jgi:hypothetical protein
MVRPEPGRAGRRPTPSPEPWLALAAALSLASGLAGGLVRLGVLPSGSALAAPVAWHGALMLCGFFGVVIGVERAAALKRGWIWAAPALAAAGSAAALARQDAVAQGLWFAGAALLTLAYAAVVRRERALHVVVEGAGALAWAIGTALWLAGRDVDTVVAWWCAFLVLTIAGERRELARFTPLSSTGRHSYVAVLALQGLALGALAMPCGAAIVAMATWWLSLLLLAAWLWRFDLACRPGLARKGWALYTARCLRLGYAWLALAAAWGLLRVAQGLPLAGPGPLHMLLLGFVFAMVFGHAPIVLPALLHRAIAPPAALALAPALLMSAAVALRALGDLLGSGPLRAIAGGGQVLAILVFAASMLARLRAQPPG